MIKVKDVIKKTPVEMMHCAGQTKEERREKHCYNLILKQILNSEIDLAKVIDVEKLERRIRRVELSTYEIVDDTEMGVKKLRGVMCKELAQAILTNINQCLKEEG